MRINTWIKFTSIIILLAMLSGCQKDIQTIVNASNNAEKEVKILSIALMDEDIILDPQLADNKASLEIINATYEGLVRLKANGKVEKGSGLALDWDISEDGLIYTFYLNEVSWSDGSKITAEDFKQSWLRALTPKTNAYYADQLYAIKNARKFHHGEIRDPDEVMINVIDEKTLKIELEKPSTVFLTQISLPIFFPCKSTDIFSGPFTVSSSEKDAIILMKNKDYWDAEKVFLDKIEVYLTLEEDEKIQLFQSGDLDSFELSDKDIGKYQNSEPLDEDIVKHQNSDLFQEVSQGSVWWIEFNTEDDLFKSKQIRQAFSYSIDRQKIVDEIVIDGAMPAYGIVPSKFPTQSGIYYKYEKDHILGVDGYDKALEEEAENLLSYGLGYSNKNSKNKLTVHLLVRDTEKAKEVAYALEDMWSEKLGINVIVEAVSLKVQLDRMISGDYQMAYTGWTGSYNDPEDFLKDKTSSSENNYSGWKNKGYDEEIKKLETAIGYDRVETLLHAEKILIKEMLISPIYFKTKGYLTNEKVKDLIRLPVGGGNEYKYLYFE